MRYWPLALLISQFVFAADLYTITASDSCKLKKNIGGQWVDASRSELENMSFPIRQFPNTQTFAVRMNGVWYGGPKNCFESANPTSHSEGGPAPVKQAEPEKAREVVSEPEAKSSNAYETASDFQGRKLSFELDGIYSMARGADFQAGDSGAVTKGAAPGFMGFGIKGNYFLSPNIEVWGGVNIQSTTQKISSPGGDGSTQYALIEPEVGSRFYLGGKKFRPYLGLELGYAMLGADVSIGSLNVAFSGSALSFGAMAGADYFLSERWALVFELAYRAMSFSSFEVKSTSDPGVFPSGSQQATSVNPISVLFGIRFGF